MGLSRRAERRRERRELRRQAERVVRAIHAADLDDLERIRLEIAAAIDWPPTADELLKIVDERERVLVARARGTG